MGRDPRNGSGGIYLGWRSRSGAKSGWERQCREQSSGAWLRHIGVRDGTRTYRTRVHGGESAIGATIFNPFEVTYAGPAPFLVAGASQINFKRLSASNGLFILEVFKNHQWVIIPEEPLLSLRQRAHMVVAGGRQARLSSRSAKWSREETESRMSEVKRRPNTPMWREIDALRHQTVGQLRVRYLRVFNQESRSNNQKFLVRRIAWRMQANAEGGLSERARERAIAVAEEADLRIRAPQSFLKELVRQRLPPACWRNVSVMTLHPVLADSRNEYESIKCTVGDAHRAASVGY